MPPDETPTSLTLQQAYHAMYRFVDAYFDRGGSSGDDLVLLLSYMEPGKWDPWDENPVGAGDPAAWSDWTSAVRTTLSSPDVEIDSQGGE